MKTKTKAVRKREAVAKVKRLLKKYVSPSDALVPSKPHPAVKRAIYRYREGIALLFSNGAWTTSVDNGYEGCVLGFSPVLLNPYLYALVELELLEEEERDLFREWLRAADERQDRQSRLKRLEWEAEIRGYVLVKKKKVKMKAC